MIPYGKQHILQEDIDAVIDVLTSDFLTQGPKVPEFENAIANFCDVKNAVAANSATSALHISCLALGLQKGDWLWTTPISFVASANCGIYCGANIDFVDIDPQTYNLSISALEEKLIEAKKNNCLPKIVIPVHLCGQSCEMEKIYNLGQRYGFSIIEDASHAVGGKYKGRNIGGCEYSDVTIFSFHPVKIITTAEGGIAVTNSNELANKMRQLRSHGITRDLKQMTHEPDGPWYYQQIALGFNYRMTDIQAALGASQLQRLEQYIVRRHEIASRYNEALKDLPLFLPFQHSDSYSSFHLYVIRLDISSSKITHKDLFERLRQKDIGVNLHYIPIHLQPYYQNRGFKAGLFPEAEKYYKEAISLPMYPGLTNQDQDYVVHVMREAFSL